MRVLILSDVHANLAALEAVLAATEGAYDELWNLGDTVGYGPHPNECFERLNAIATIQLGRFDDQQHRRAEHQCEKRPELAVDKQEIERPERQVDRPVRAQRERIEHGRRRQSDRHHIGQQYTHDGEATEEVERIDAHAVVAHAVLRIPFRPLVYRLLAWRPAPPRAKGIARCRA